MYTIGNLELTEEQINNISYDQFVILVLYDTLFSIEENVKSIKKQRQEMIDSLKTKTEK